MSTLEIDRKSKINAYKGGDYENKNYNSNREYGCKGSEAC